VAARWGAASVESFAEAPVASHLRTVRPIGRMATAFHEDKTSWVRTNAVRVQPAEAWTEDVPEFLGRVLRSTRIIRLSLEEKRLSVVMLKLCGRSDIVLRWIKLQQLQKWRWKSGLADEVTVPVLEQWCQDLSEDATVANLLANPRSNARGTVHIFLVQSVLAERVRDCLQGGLLVHPSFVLDKYVAMLRLLPPCRIVERHRNSLESHEHASKKWSKKFRDAWGLTWGSCSLPHGISRPASVRRAAVFIRWIRHVCASLVGSAEVVVINMDETNLHNLKQWKRGVTDATGEVQVSERAAKDAALPRTTLMASVCSDVALQRALPQIRLPRGRGGALPSRIVVGAYADAGPPQVTVHGTNGFVTVNTLRYYLRLLAQTVRRVRPNSVPVLVMDCCPVHLVDEVLNTARTLGVVVIFVPAKMTWMLQPLDTHVFAVLKAKLRAATFEAKATNRTLRLPHLALVRLHGTGIREVLVNNDWSDRVKRGGLTGDLDVLRPALQELLAGQSLDPRAPTVAELADVLSVTLPRAARLEKLLFPIVTGPRVVPVVLPSSLDVAAAGPERLDGTDRERRVAAFPIPLSRLIRLPPRPSGVALGANAWLPPSSQSRVQTRSMTAAALRTSFASALPRPPLPPPPPARRLRSSPALV